MQEIKQRLGALSRVELLELTKNLLEKTEKLQGFKSQEKEFKKVIEKLEKPTYKIVVFASMSAGKSTFLNSLFGSNILPTSTKATTDCATEIYHCDKRDIRAEIYFTDDKEKVNLDGEEKIKELKEYAKKDEDCSDDKYKNVEKIKLYYHFPYIKNEQQEEFEVVFIDTPGPDSTGKAYKEKHQNQTREALRNSDMALMLFDASEIDKYLEDQSIENGLWESIKKQKEDKSKNFEVYFVANKIDIVAEDVFGNYEAESKEKEYKFYKENWYKAENECLEKLKLAAKNHGIENPKVYGVSSLQAYYQRAGNSLSGVQKDKHDIFKKLLSRRFCNKDVEKELIDYCGVEKLENDLNDYINNQILQKLKNMAIEVILKSTQEILNELDNKLDKLNNVGKATLEAQINNAEEYIKKDTPLLEEKFIDEIKSLNQEFENSIKAKLDDNIQKHFIKKIEEITLITTSFIINRVGEIEDDKTAYRIALEDYKNYTINGEIRKINNKYNLSEKDLENSTNYCIKNRFNTYQNSYLDTISDIKNMFKDFANQNDEIVQKYKKILEANINDKLKFTPKRMELFKLDTNKLDSLNSFSLSNSVTHEKHAAVYKSNFVWWNPFSWFSSDTKVQDASNKFVFSAQKIYDDFYKNIKAYANNIQMQEEEKCLLVLRGYKNDGDNVFNEFIADKKEQIASLKNSLNNIEQSIKINQDTIKTFENILKGEENE